MLIHSLKSHLEHAKKERINNGSYSHSFKVQTRMKKGKRFFNSFTNIRREKRIDNLAVEKNE